MVAMDGIPIPWHENRSKKSKKYAEEEAEGQDQGRYGTEIQPEGEGGGYATMEDDVSF